MHKVRKKPSVSEVCTAISIPRSRGARVTLFTMLSVIAGAKRAKKDEAGQAQRITRHHAILEAAAKEVEARLLKAIQDGFAARDAEGAHQEMRHEIGILKRRSMDLCTIALQEEAVLQRKQLHEKEMFWKLKLETNRVAATAQLRNETRKLEANHETSLRQRLLEQREQLLSGSDGGLRDALQRLDEADEQIHELKRKIAALNHDLKAASVEQLEAAEQAFEARRHNEELQVEAHEEARRVAKLRNELEDSAVHVARLTKQLEDLAGAKAEADALRTDMWALQTMAEAMRGRAEAAESARDAAYAERDEYRAEYRAAKAQREAFRMELEVAIADLAQARVVAAEAEERMADMERLKEEMEQKAMDAVGQKLVAAEAVAVAAREQAVKAEQHATTVEQALATSKALVQELQALRDQARAEGGVRAEELAAVRAQSQLYERECDKLRAALQAAQAETDRRVSQLQEARSMEQPDIGAGGDRDVARMAHLGQQLKGAAKQISDLQDTLQHVQAASKADRERLIAISLESLSSLRAHLVRSFTGGRRPAVLVNGVDPVPMMVRVGLAKKVESMAMHSRRRMHLMVNASSVTAAMDAVTIKASVSLPDIPKGARATGDDSGLSVSDAATHGPLPKGKKTEVYSGRPCSYLDVDEEGEFGDFDGGEYVWPDAPGSVGLPPGPGPGTGQGPVPAPPEPSRTLRNRVPAGNAAAERDVRNAINKAKANGDPLYTVFYSRLY